jgi:hypothetical protein
VSSNGKPSIEARKARWNTLARRDARGDRDAGASGVVRPDNDTGGGDTGFDIVVVARGDGGCANTGTALGEGDDTGGDAVLPAVALSMDDTNSQAVGCSGSTK